MRYLFCSLNNYGFLYSSIGIADALRRRGHEIAFVTDASMDAAVARAGFTRIARGDQDGPSFLVERSGDPLDTVRQVRHIERALRRFETDVLVGQQLGLGAPIAAARQGVPVAMIGLGAYIWPTETPPAEPSMREYVRQRYRGFYLCYKVVCEMLGMQPQESTFEDSPILGHLFLLRSVPELEGNIDELPQRVHCVGDCLWDLGAQEDAALAQWCSAAKASGDPIVYVQPGRVFEKRSYWRDLVDALGSAPVRVVAAVGRMDRETGELPPNFFVRPHVPQSAVLPHCRAVVCSSTTTAILGALTHGLPLLLIPGGGGAEQVDGVLRCLRANVAIHLRDSEVTSERVSEAVQRLLYDPEFRSRAEILQAAFARMAKCETAADLLEELGRRRTPILRAEVSSACPVAFRSR